MNGAKVNAQCSFTYGRLISGALFTPSLHALLPTHTRKKYWLKAHRLLYFIYKNLGEKTWKRFYNIYKEAVQ